MNREISDERINIVMKRIQKALPLDVDSDNEDERFGQFMILAIQEGYREYIIGLEKYFLDYSKLNKNDKFHCTQILDILKSLDDKSRNKISRVLLKSFVLVGSHEQ